MATDSDGRSFIPHGPLRRFLSRNGILALPESTEATSSHRIRESFPQVLLFRFEWFEEPVSIESNVLPFCDIEQLRDTGSRKASLYRVITHTTIDELGNDHARSTNKDDVIPDTARKTGTEIECPQFQSASSRTCMAQSDEEGKTMMQNLRRHLNLASTLALGAGQVICVKTMRSYETSQYARKIIDNSMRDREKLALETMRASIVHLIDAIPPLLKALEQPSASVFVLAGLAWAAFAMLQHHINCYDRFQRLSVLIGLITGFGLCLPSLSRPEEQQVVASIMAFSITVALFVSACGHWAVAKMRSKKWSLPDLVDGKESAYLWARHETAAGKVHELYQEVEPAGKNAC